MKECRESFLKLMVTIFQGHRFSILAGFAVTAIAMIWIAYEFSRDRNHPSRTSSSPHVSEPEASERSEFERLEDVRFGHVPKEYRFAFDHRLEGAELSAAIGRLPYSKIEIHAVEGCWSDDPVYNAILYADGKAEYQGLENVSRLGKHHGEIWLERYTRLCWAIDRLKLFDPDSVPTSSVAVAGPGMSLVEITERRTGKRLKLRLGTSFDRIEEWIVVSLVEKTVDEILWTADEVSAGPAADMKAGD